MNKKFCNQDYISKQELFWTKEQSHSFELTSLNFYAPLHPMEEALEAFTVLWRWNNSMFSIHRLCKVLDPGNRPCTVALKEYNGSHIDNFTDWFGQYTGELLFDVDTETYNWVTVESNSPEMLQSDEGELLADSWQLDNEINVELNELERKNKQIRNKWTAL